MSQGTLVFEPLRANNPLTDTSRNSVSILLKLKIKLFLACKKDKARYDSETQFSHIGESWVTGGRPAPWLASSCKSLKVNHKSSRLELRRMNALEQLLVPANPNQAPWIRALHFTKYCSYTPTPCHWPHRRCLHHLLLPNFSLSLFSFGIQTAFVSDLCCSVNCHLFTKTSFFACSYGSRVMLGESVPLVLLDMWTQNQIVPRQGAILW